MELELTVGIHAIRLSRNDFADRRRQVAILADTTVEWTVDLLRAVGGVAIPSDPSGARVFLDDEAEPRGITPMLINHLAPGSHTVRLRLDGYSEIRQSFTVTANDVNQLKTIRLSRSQGQLTVMSTPVADADVYLDGTHLGQTPHTIPDVAPGPHQLRVTRAGYSNVEQTVNVTAGTNQQVTMTLERQYGNLEMVVRPWGYVFVNDEKKGASPPWIKERLGVGQHTIRIQSGSSDYQDSVFTLTIPTGETIKLTIKLKEKK